MAGERKYYLPFKRSNDHFKGKNKKDLPNGLCPSE